MSETTRQTEEGEHRETVPHKILKINPQAIPKAKTHISGLDNVLKGGFPQQRTTLIKGSAGTGKTVLGFEFLYHSAVNGEPAIFVTFEETAEALRVNALAMGWDIKAMEQSGALFLWEAQVDRNIIISGDFNIDSLFAAISGKAEQIGAKRIMIDAVDVLLRIFENPVKERNELYRLHDWLRMQQFTALLTAKSTNDPAIAYRYEFLDYMADCVVHLDMRVVNQVATRRLRIVKYRGSPFCANEYPYVITEQGNVIMPITAMELSHKPPGEKVSTGNKDLDGLLKGGFQTGTSVLISGPTGTGKTTLAATFVKGVCFRGNKVLYISFEESREAILSAMLSPGINLKPAIEQGNLHFHTIMPEALVSEEHLYKILQRIEQFQPGHIVIDAISACQRMGTKETAFDFLIRLIESCKQRAITCLMLNQLSNNGSFFNLSGQDISSLTDTLIGLRFREADRAVQRDMIIIKSRGTDHSNRYHTFRITDNGICIEPTGVTAEEKG